MNNKREKIKEEIRKKVRGIIIEKLLNEFNEFLPDRFIVVCRELTKMFEEKNCI